MNIRSLSKPIFIFFILIIEVIFVPEVEKMLLRSNYISRNFEKEFEFQYARSGGPGGQHVNKTETKVELRFHIENSELLSDEEKSIIKIKLASKINDDGYLQIIVQDHRSQLRNKELAQERFYLFLAEALKKERKRIRTKPTRKSIERRLENKKKLSEKKQTRFKPKI